MNFRSCKYFLTVCEMGTLNAAARKLYISQQSLSKHIQKMEQELGAQLMYRENPIVLTEAGECVRRAAGIILDTMSQMESEIAACTGRSPNELVLGLADYGVPEFLPPMLEILLKKDPNVLIRTKDVMAGQPIPPDIDLIISSREMGVGYKSELLLSDRIVVCVSDDLLKRQYGAQWEQVRQRLEEGDIFALEGCPFVRHYNTPLQFIQEMGFSQIQFQPEYLPIVGGAEALSRLTADGQAACVTFWGHAEREGMPPCYPIDGLREPIPSVFISYPAKVVLSSSAQHFLEISRRYLKRREETE